MSRMQAFPTRDSLVKLCPSSMGVKGPQAACLNTPVGYHILSSVALQGMRSYMCYKTVSYFSGAVECTKIRRVEQAQFHPSSLRVHVVSANPPRPVI